MSGFGPQSRLPGTKQPDATQRAVNTPVAVKRRFTDKLSAPAKCRRATDPYHGKILQHKLVLTSGQGAEGFSRLNDIGIGDVTRTRVKMDAPTTVAGRDFYIATIEGHMRKVGVSYGTGSANSAQDVATTVQGLVPIEASSGSAKPLEPFTKVKWQFPRPSTSKATFNASDLTHGCFAQDPDGIYPQMVPVNDDGSGVQDAASLVSEMETCLAADSRYIPRDAESLGKILAGGENSTHLFFKHLLNMVMIWIEFGEEARLGDGGVIMEDGAMALFNHPVAIPTGDSVKFLGYTPNFTPTISANVVHVNTKVVMVAGHPMTTESIGYKGGRDSVSAGRRFMGAVCITRAIASALANDDTAAGLSSAVGHNGAMTHLYPRGEQIEREFLVWIASLINASSGLHQRSQNRIVGTVMKDDGRGSMTVLLDP